MDGKESIIARILEDADARAEVIEKTAKDAREESIKEATAWAEEYKRTQTEILDFDSANLIARRKTLADLDVKKVILSAKRRVIDKTTEKVLDNLLNLDKEKYLSLTATLIEKYAEEGDVIKLPVNSPVTEEDVSSLAVCKKRGLKVMKDRGDFVGGVKLIGEICDKDLSFKSYVGFSIENYLSETCEKLFKTE